MATAAISSKPTLGFLTVLDHPQHGLFGGYLVLNLVGRPLEFHCTAPIKANRAQQILYGPTLESFLYGEQIGQTLLAQAKNEPLAVCTDRRAALAVREHVSLPVALVLPNDDEGTVPIFVAGGHDNGTVPFGTPDPPQHGAANLMVFQLGRNRLAVGERSAADRDLIAQRLAAVAESFDLAEPFGRIREAIEEAQQSVR